MQAQKSSIRKTGHPIRPKLDTRFEASAKSVYFPPESVTDLLWNTQSPVDPQLKHSLQLLESLENRMLRSKQSLRTALNLETEISLWEVVAPYLALYRFPLLFLPEGRRRSWRQRLDHVLWPYRGLARHFRDFVVSPPWGNTNACMQWTEEGSSVLFLGFSPTHYRDVLHHVAELLVKKTHLQGVVIGHGLEPPPGVETPDRLRFESIWEHWSADVEGQASVMLERLLEVQRTVLNRAEFSALTQEVKLCFDRSALRREFTWLFWREFKRLIYHIAVGIHVLDRHRPVLIIYADDTDQRCRIYSLLGRTRGIPSLIVQQGLTQSNYPEWVFFSADSIAAMGQTSLTAMIAQGVPPERITVTGHPGFDALLVPQPDVCARLRSELKLKTGQYMVLFASQPFYIGAFQTPEVRRIMIKAIVEAVSSVENIHLVIKPHPGEDAQKLRTLVGTKPRVTMVDPAMDITPLIKACDILITFFSQSAMQALYMGKRVINVAFPDSGGPTLYLESGTTWIARSPSEIIARLRELTHETRSVEMAMRDDVRQRFVYEWAHLQDGRAGERVVQAIVTLLGLRESEG